MATSTGAPRTRLSSPLTRPQPLASPDRITFAWVVNFFRRELAPYPGRASTVARMTIAATIVMLVIMTFHIPGGALGGYYALLISRENLRSTVQQAVMNTLAFVVGAIYTLLGVALFVASPVTHFFWVIGSLYLIFFVMGTVRNYGMAAGFSFLIATAIPLWDRPGPVELKIYGTLWTLLSVAVGSAAALLVEVVYHSFHPQDSVVTGLVQRLHTVEETLRTYARGERLTGKAQSRLMQYAMLGPASLRRAIIRAGQSPRVRPQIAALVSLTGRLVDLSVNLEQTLGPAVGLSAEASANERCVTLPLEETARLNTLADAVAAEARSIRGLPTIEAAVQLRTPPWHGPETPAPTVPLLPVLERTVTMLRSIFSVSPDDHDRDQALLALLDKPDSSRLFVADAFTNRDHLTFALRGCLAASLCYVLYNAIDWPGINTAVATCIITALGTIGSSRQKQVLRIGGAVTGGFLISLPAQVYLLPYMDSITAFTLFFAAGSAIAAWFATASPRLSYFGLQIALAFYLINLQEFTVQISLAVARDRVVGELLGLLAMWFVFDQLWAPLASVRMQTLLAANLEALSRTARALALLDTGSPATQRATMLELRHLREKINAAFSQMNEQADAVQFEVGLGREQKLRTREQMQAMQPAMRTIFLLQLALVQYSTGVRRSVREPSSMRAMAGEDRALVHFLEASARLLDDAAKAVKGQRPALPNEEPLAAVRAASENIDREPATDTAVTTLCREIAKSLEVLWRAQQNRSEAAPV